MWGEAQTQLWDQLLTDKPGVAGKTRAEGVAESSGCRSEPRVQRNLQSGQLSCEKFCIYIFFLLSRFQGLQVLDPGKTEVDPGW